MVLLVEDGVERKLTFDKVSNPTEKFILWSCDAYHNSLKLVILNIPLKPGFPFKSSTPDETAYDC